MTLWPLCKKYRVLLLSMTAVSSLGIALMIGLGGAYDTLALSLHGYVQQYRCADALLTTAPCEAALQEELQTLPGVIRADSRLVGELPARRADGRVLTVRAFTESLTDFQRFFVWQQAERADLPNIALEYKFAGRNGLAAGDTLELFLQGEWRTVCVGRVVSSPECIVVVPDEYAWGENADFGYLFAPAELLTGTEAAGQADQFLLQLAPRADRAAALEAAKQTLQQAGVEVYSALLYEDTPVSSCIEVNLEPLDTMSGFLPGIFFAAMIAVVALFLSQLIRQYRREIGIFRAVGFAQGRLRGLFCVLMLLVSGAAALLGLGVGLGLMRVAGRLYAYFFPLPRLTYTLRPERCLTAVLLTVGAGQAAALVSTSLLTGIHPAEAMSRPAPAGRALPRWLRTAAGRLGPAAKYALSSLLRNRRRFAFSVLCTAASLSMILTALAFDRSKREILTRLYDERILYDAQCFFTQEPDPAALDEGRTELLLWLRAEAEFAGRRAELLVNGIDPETRMVGIPGPDERTGQRLTVPEQGILLEAHTAAELGAAVGDTVTVNGVPLRVEGLSDQSVNRISYLSHAQAAVLEQPERYVLLVQGAAEETLTEAVSQWPGYCYTVFPRLLRQANEEIFAAYSVASGILTLFAVLLGLLVVHNTTQTNLLEQKRELAVLRALGFQHRELSGLWLAQSLTRFGLACGVGLPLGSVIARLALERMATEGRAYPYPQGAGLYGTTAMLVLAYTLVSHALAMRGMRGWDIAEATKEKE